MKRPAPISVFSDQRRMKSTIWSRVSCGTQTPVRVPQAFFLARRAPPSIRPGPHLWSESSSQGSRFVPAWRNGWAALSAERQPFRSRRTPSANGRIPSAGGRACHIILRSEPAPTDAAAGWRLSLPACSASVASSCVRSIILMGERFVHFQLNRNNLKYIWNAGFVFENVNCSPEIAEFGDGAFREFDGCRGRVEVVIVAVPGRGVPDWKTVDPRWLGVWGEFLQALMNELAVEDVDSI